MDFTLRKNHFGTAELRWPARLGQARSVWSLWLIWFIWLVSFNQKTRQTEQTKWTRLTGGLFLQPAVRCGKRHSVVEARVTTSRGREPLCPRVSRARLPCRARRSHADGFLILLNVEREKRGIPCQDTDLVDFMQVIR